MPYAPAHRLLSVLAAAAIAMLCPLCAEAGAKVVTVGPRLDTPANLDTNTGLGYEGVDTAVPPAPDAPDGVVHTAHFGADTAIWNTTVEGHSAAMPHAGQAVGIRLEGCATQPAGAPAPLSQIHFQTLNRQGGGLRVMLTSGAFTIPTCGVDGAGATTVTTYTPYNLCVGKGDYVDFNDEGGFEEPFYRGGVPYRVLGSAGRSALTSFIRGNGTGNGALFVPSERSAMEGWAGRSGAQLLMQVELGTGADARYVCPTGTKEAPPVLAPMRISRQTDGINHARMVAVAIFCRPASGCHGGARLEMGSAAAGAEKVGSAAFSLPGNATTHLPIRVTPRVLDLIRRNDGVQTRIVAHMGGHTFVQRITIRII